MGPHPPIRFRFATDLLPIRLSKYRFRFSDSMATGTARQLPPATDPNKLELLKSPGHERFDKTCKGGVLKVCPMTFVDENARKRIVYDPRCFSPMLFNLLSLFIV